MGHIVHVEGVAYGRTLAGHTASLVATAWRLQIRHTATSCGEYVSNVVVGGTNHVVARVDVLPKHGPPAPVAVRVSRSIQKNQFVVVGHEFHGQTSVPLEDAVHPDHGGVHCRKHAAHIPSVERRVLPCARQSQTVGPQLRAIVHTACGGDGMETHGLDFFASGMRFTHRRLHTLARLGKFQGHATFRALRGAGVEVGTIVNNDMLTIAGRVGIDEYGFPWAHDHRVEPVWCHIKTDGGFRCVHPLSCIHLDARESGRQLGSHDGAVDHAKALHPSIGQGQRENRLGSTGVKGRRMRHLSQPSFQTSHV